MVSKHLKALYRKSSRDCFGSTAILLKINISFAFRGGFKNGFQIRKRTTVSFEFRENFGKKKSGRSAEEISRKIQRRKVGKNLK